MNYEKETTGISTYVSLCSGYDGIGIGLKRAIPNLRTIAHVEIETYAIANLIAKMEAGQLDACPVFTDLKQFPYRELRDRVTILSAGFPCQPFSSAGKRQATEDPRHLYPWIANGITAMRPRYVFLENVEGIISAKTGDGESVLKYVLGDLEERGYSCAWGIFSASEVGAPHQRKRVFILGYSSSEGLEGTTRQSVQRRSERLTSTARTRYPAGPEEEQYDWEEPRVTMGYSKSSERDITRLSMRTEQENTKLGEQCENKNGTTAFENSQSNREIKPCVGGTANGTSYRVDRLRLLGNGVVPDTCELAFKTLIKQL